MTQKANLQRTFAYLKDANLFNGGYGKSGLKDSLTRMEQRRKYKDVERHPRKKNR